MTDMVAKQTQTPKAPKAQKVFLGNWNVELYYEAMGLDWDDEVVENENDNLN